MRRAHAMPFGTEIMNDGVRFALWAPTASRVDLVVDGSELPMPALEGGWRSLVVSGAKAGSRYAYRIDGGIIVPDSASRYQPTDVHGPSEVVDPRAYRWSDATWAGRPWAEVVLYEAHVGTATVQGTFAALADRLEVLRDVGINALELMPIGEFAGRRNWGYDGVLPYAPEAGYGRPEDLKALIDRAHRLGLMIFLDVVYNHFGPTGNYLHAYAGSFFTERHQTPWGAGINFDGRSGPTVREFFVHNALYWLTEFHVDGLRVDAADWILDDSDPHILKEIAERARAACPGREIHLVLENDRNQATWLERDGRNRAPLYDAQWNDDIHHCWHALLSGEAEGYYSDYADRPVERLGRCLATGFAYQGDVSTFRGGKRRGEASDHLPPSAFVSFLQNHDQVGNRALGERLQRLAAPERLALGRALLLLAPQIPLLFMGEEWGASTPFLFFVDFPDDPDLARAVRDGRRHEFRHFKAFGEAVEVADPTALATFEASRPDWGEAAVSPHADILAETRTLLASRAEKIVPLTKTRFLGAQLTFPAPEAIDVRWRFAAGSLRILANFGATDIALAAAELDAGLVFASPGIRRGAETIVLPTWTGLVLSRDAP